jgi:hypothetical protein
MTLQQDGYLVDIHCQAGARAAQTETTKGQKMGSREHLDADPHADATVMELWGADELGDDDAGVGIDLRLAAVTALLIALALFFLAFAPGA